MPIDRCIANQTNKACDVGRVTAKVAFHKRHTQWCVTEKASQSKTIVSFAVKAFSSKVL